MPPINPRVIKGITPSLQWLSDLLAFFQVETIRIPAKYREKVLVVKRLLNDDPSGLAGSIADFAISAAGVDYHIETENQQLTEILNNWLGDVNAAVRGNVPTGIDALAKEYFRERWKGSSNLLLRTFWETDKNGLKVPTVMFFVDGEDIKVASKSTDGVLRLGDEAYFLKVGDPLDYSNKIKPKDVPLPSAPNEKIFVQRPFESWGVREPVPFMIKRGIFRASKMLELMQAKGELIVGRALEYLLIMKKGSKELFQEGITYDENDLKKANEDLKDVVARRKVQPGFSSFATNFDTEISEYIPDYKKAIDTAIYAPMEQKILAGWGMIEVISSIQLTERRSAAMNPKPFVAEINAGVEDFKTLLTDVIKTIIAENSANHRKWMQAKIKIISSPIKEFIEEDAKATLRSLYDRGLLSKRTAVEILGNVDFDFEVMRRENEDSDDLSKKMYPPVIQNTQSPGLIEVPGQVGELPPEPAPGGAAAPKPAGDTSKEPSKKKKVTPDKQGPEAKNYNASGKTPLEQHQATME